MADNLSQEQLDMLWDKYKKTGDVKIRNELLMHYIKVVEIIAKKMYPIFRSHADLDDIVSCGIIALMTAMDNFDISRGIKFETFASVRVRGSIIDYIRKQDWIPRSVREKSRTLEDAFTKLRSSLGREPLDEEVADFLNIGAGELEQLMSETQVYNVMSYEEMLADNTKIDFEDDCSDTPSSMVLEQELKSVLAKCIDRLSEKERMVVSLYYYDELKICEIAQVMQVSESRICQIHSKALMKIKAMMFDYVNNA